MAQLVARTAGGREVAGSSPVTPTIAKIKIMITHLLYFVLCWAPVIYIFNCLVARKIIIINWPKALLYISSTAMLGMIGEITTDTIYRAITGKLLWTYHVLPIHNTYTSKYSFFLWGLVGFHVYLLHKTLKSRGVSSLNKLALIFCFEAIILDGLINLSFLVAFGDYIYYYLPGDIFHLTSLQTLPCYLIAGYVAVIMYNTFERKQTLFTTLSICAAALIAFILPNFNIA